MVTEYIETLTLTKSDITKIQDAQQNIYEKGFVEKDYSQLINFLGSSSTVLGLAFVAPSPVAIAGAISALVSTLGSSFASLKHIVVYGYYDLGKIRTWMEKHPNYDMVKVKMSFIHYKDKGIRFIQHTDSSYITAVHTKGGWREQA